MLENFNPLINLFLFVPDSQVLVPQLLSFDNGANKDGYESWDSKEALEALHCLCSYNRC